MRNHRKLGAGIGVGVAIVALGLVPAASSAQDWREVTSFRQRAGESHVEVEVNYGAGEMRIDPTSGTELYRVGLRYDSDAFDPVTEYRNGKLEVGVEGRGRGLKVRNSKAGNLDLSLTREVPMELDLHFGAVEADIELGGLRLTRLDIETGASDTHVRFSEPNPVSCERLEISMGAAALRADRIGNANCRRLNVEGGVGDLTLDFGGDWRDDMHADITVALGSVTLYVPEDVGVRVQKETFLADFSASGFSKRDGTYYSDNWADASHRLTVDLEGAFGSFDVRWRSASAGGR